MSTPLLQSRALRVAPIIALLIIGIAFSDFSTVSQTETPVPIATQETSIEFRPYFIDPETWMLISPDGDADQVAHLNTDEHRWARYNAIISISNPSYSFPETVDDPAVLERENPAIFAILYPALSAARADNAKTDEQRQAEAEALEAILNPEGYYQEYVRLYGPLPQTTGPQ